LFKLFDILENDQNYFSKREGLKTQYMLLVRNETLRKIYTSDKERLKAIMVTVLNQNKGIQYEAFLLLSLFILMPQENDAVSYTLKMNKGNLTDFIKNFQ
jgi:Mo25-like